MVMPEGLANISSGIIFAKPECDNHVCIAPKCCIPFITCFLALTHNLTKQWQCNNYFNVPITVILVTSQKRHRVVSEIAGVFSGRAILEIIAREGNAKHVIALCFQPIKTLDFTQICNKLADVFSWRAISEIIAREGHISLWSSAFNQ